MAKSEYVLTYRCAFARFFEINRISFMWLCRLNDLRISTYDGWNPTHLV